MDEQVTSRRSARIQAAAPFRMLSGFLRRRAAEEQGRRGAGLLDFTFGDPHEMQLPAYVDALREAAVPLDEQWFAYKQSEPAAQEAAAASLERVVPLGWTGANLRMTTGGFGAITVAMKAVADPGDEVVYSLPPWFLYEILAIEAGLVPVKVPALQPTFDLDLDAIAAAITPRTRIVVVNSPNNPSGRVYPPATLSALSSLLEQASVRHGRRIWLVSDEPYNRIVFDGVDFHSPAEFYPWTMLCYSYGKTLLAPGQRLGYLAVPPGLPENGELMDAVDSLQVAGGWLFPNAVMQHAVPQLEELSIDVAALAAKRDRFVTALREMGYEVTAPEGTFYLWPRSPIPDDEAFVAALERRGVLVMPGALFETPGWFRICLTATAESIEAALPHFTAVLDEVRAEPSGQAERSPLGTSL